MTSKLSLTLLLAGTFLSGHALVVPSEARAQEEEEAAASSPKTLKMKKSNMRQLMKILKGEPSIKKTQNWALRHYKLGTSRINGMAINARLKGLIPEVSVNFTANQGRDFRNMRDGLYPDLPDNVGNPNDLKERTAGTNSRNTFHVGGKWVLDRLVFNAEALDVKSLNSLGETLVREVSTLYFSRRRLLAGIILSPPEDPEELFFELVRLDEITATLDALTGNRYSKTTWQWSDSLIGL